MPEPCLPRRFGYPIRNAAECCSRSAPPAMSATRSGTSFPGRGLQLQHRQLQCFSRSRGSDSGSQRQESRRGPPARPQRRPLRSSSACSPRSYQRHHSAPSSDSRVTACPHGARMPYASALQECAGPTGHCNAVVCVSATTDGIWHGCDRPSHDRLDSSESGKVGNPIGPGCGARMGCRRPQSARRFPLRRPLGPSLLRNRAQALGTPPSPVLRAPNTGFARNQRRNIQACILYRDETPQRERPCSLELIPGAAVESAVANTPPRGCPHTHADEAKKKGDEGPHRHVTDPVEAAPLATVVG